MARKKKRYNETIDDLFGALRELMNLGVWEHSDRQALLRLIRKASAMHSARYVEQWLPYMQGYTHHFKPEFACFGNLQEFAKVSELLPHARFSIRVYDQPPEALIRFLAQPDSLPALNVLDISRCRLTDDVFRSIIKKNALRHLRCLSLTYNYISPEGVQALVDAGEQPSLTELNLYQNQLGDAGVAALDSLNAPSLRILGVNWNGIKDDGVRALADLELLTSVEQLNLSANAFGCQGLAALVRSPYLGSLEDLDLFSTQIGFDGLRQLVESRYAPQLERLGLEACELGYECFELLAQSPSLANLHTLDVYHEDVSLAARQALANSPYLCESIRTRFA